MKQIDCQTIIEMFVHFLVSDRTEPDMSFELLEPDKSPAQLKPDFWLEYMSRTL